MSKISFYCDVHEVGLPLIKVYTEGLGDIVMLIDSGATSNILFRNTYRDLEKFLKPIDEKKPTYSLDGKIIELEQTCGIVTIGDKEHEMRFAIKENDDACNILTKELGFRVYGIIGSDFMVEHNWTINYAKQEIVIPDIDINTLDFKALRNKASQVT